MAELKTDRELLREYAERGAEGAFQKIVERHVDLVFGTAMRGTNNAQAAQEIAQNVFITLARKATWLQAELSLAGWLHKTALLEIRGWWRGELRRQRREQMAVELGTTMKDEDSTLKALAGELDDGLLKLRETDRQALMLRYFEGRSHREIGALLGASEDAARMRIDKALAGLTRFFRRRGHAVPAAATTAALLAGAAKAAPAGFATVAAHAGLAAGTGASVGALKLLISRFMALTKTQTAVLCVTLAGLPVGWEWNVNRVWSRQASASQSKLEIAREQQEQSWSEIDRLRADSARLDTALADAEQAQARYAQAARKLETLNTRARGMLTDANYHWPDDLPYVRVPKSVVRSLDLLNHSPTPFGRNGLSDAAVELFGITAQEKGPTEQALATYRRGVDELMNANAYETNVPGSQSGRLTKTVVVPPLGQPLKELAENTRTQLADVLGAEREKLLFDGWDQGGIQIFWPGNLWKIAEQPQTFQAWFEPARTDGSEPRYGASRAFGTSGTSAEGPTAFGIIPKEIVTRFFSPWLQQLGLSKSASDKIFTNDAIANE